MARGWMENIMELETWKGMASWNTYVVALLVCLVFAWLRSTKGNRGKLPPGPMGFPIVGYLPFLGKHGEVVFRDLSKTYGPVVRVGLGAVNLITLNDLNSIKEGLSKRELLYRPHNTLQRQGGIRGISTLNGEAWEVNRRFCIRVLRDLGFGKKTMEEHIKEEVQYLIGKISESGGLPLQVEDYLLPSMSNNIAALVYGSRYSYEDPKRKFLDDALRRVLRFLETRSLISFLPSLLNRIASLPLIKARTDPKVFAEFEDYQRREIEAHKSTLEEHSNRDLIDGYLKKMQEHENDPASHFTMEYLLGTIANLIGAGSTTVQMTVHWHLLNCARRVDQVQKKIQSEIDEVIGCERIPTWEDRNRMPFTMATIWEMYRWRTVSPVGLPRAVAEDTYINGYLLPAGSVVLPNLWAVHMDPNIWEQPEDYDPTRFLKRNGKELADKPEHLIPFSLGKRMCPGETLATVQIFLYLTSILQKFTILPEDGKTIDMTPRGRTLCYPAPQKLRFIPRRTMA